MVITLGRCLLIILKKLSFLQFNPAEFEQRRVNCAFFNPLFVFLPFFFPYPLLDFVLFFTDLFGFPGWSMAGSGTGLFGFPG